MNNSRYFLDRSARRRNRSFDGTASLVTWKLLQQAGKKRQTQSRRVRFYGPVISISEPNKHNRFAIADRTINASSARESPPTPPVACRWRSHTVGNDPPATPRNHPPPPASRSSVSPAHRRNRPDSAQN